MIKYIGYLVMLKKTVNEEQMKRVTDLLESMPLIESATPIELDMAVSVAEEMKKNEP